MPPFFRRKVISPLHKVIQREAAGKKLRNRLWNAL